MDVHSFLVINIHLTDYAMACYCV